MTTAILITLIMIVIFGAVGAAVFIMIKKVDPKNKDTSENPDITEAQEFLPFEDITNNMIVLPNHRYRAVLACSSTNYQLKTNNEREQIEMSFQRFLNTITFPITLFLQTKVIDNTERMKILEKDAERIIQEFPNMQNYAEQYQKDMANLNQKIGNNQQKKRYIIVTYDDSGTLDTLSDEEKVIHAEKEIQHRCNGLISNLQSVGVKSTVLRTPELVELIYSCYYRDDYSYAEAIADNEPFTMFVNGAEDKFRDIPKAVLLDLILGEAINKIELSNADADPGGRMTLEGLKELRNKYAGYFQEDPDESEGGLTDVIQKEED